jgi:hypothetical protein
MLTDGRTDRQYETTNIRSLQFCERAQKAKILNLRSIIKRLAMKCIKACRNIKHFILMPYQLILKFLYLTFQVMVTTDMMEEFF